MSKCFALSVARMAVMHTLLPAGSCPCAARSQEGHLPQRAWTSRPRRTHTCRVLPTSISDLTAPHFPREGHVAGFGNPEIKNVFISWGR
eukprot:9475852-Pyramimonas_sp.AAC.1